MEMRQLYQAIMNELLETHSEVVMLDADLASASGSTQTFKRFPQQTVNVGISEANMVSSACGMALTGLKPYIHTFAPFATRRVFDQVFMSGAYSRNAIHIYGSDPGFWAQHNGGTHTSYEDIALMRTLPGAVVCAPSDAKQFEFILRHFLTDHRLYYTRATRKALPDIYSQGDTFQLGTWITLETGSDCVIFAIGAMVHEALEASKLLRLQGIEATVVDAFSIKPHDAFLIATLGKEHTRIITVENHSIYGGLGDLVASELMQSGGTHKFVKIGVQDQFGEVGTADYLQRKHGLNASHIVAEAKKLMDF